MEATPSFRRVPGSEDLLLQHTPHAASVSAAIKAATVRFVAKAPEEVGRDVVAHVVSQGGDPGNSMLVLSQSTMQFGKYRVQTLQWLLTNDMGYAVSLVTSHQREQEGDSSMANKDALISYACAFPDVASAVRDQRAQDVARLRSSQPSQEDLRLVAFGVHKDLAWRDLRACHWRAASVCVRGHRRSCLVHLQLKVLLPEAWKQSLPKEQHEWIARALFIRNRIGKLELTSDLRLWWFPPQPRLIHNQPPASPGPFCHPLFLWMPCRMWAFKLTCTQPECLGHKLTGVGLYKTVRRVLSIDGWYDVATEYLECHRCKKKVAGWSSHVLNQLDPAHRSHFPAILTYGVLRLMRERTLGNSATQLYNTLCEQHSEAWMQRSLQYLAEFEPFLA
ncbi:uncharacterized protein LOC117430939 [Acipenser ruthenus]|uniref:uncharacterized protein LOC117430939 n=1 Tax=Acipenser ruthenus TaxID=7906 RepID=UPI002741464D|nr:uncharacterized protein LOC117430939 [Acipenser ruthenus]